MSRSVLAALFGALACYGVLALTEPPGPGLDPDSMSYLGAAQSLAWHGTLRIPMAGWHDADSTSPLGHFPPGFPLAVAGAVSLGAPAEQAARAVIALAAFATVALAVEIVVAVSGPLAAAVTGAVLVASPSLIQDHAAVLSEPLCLTLIVATLALMAFSERPLAYGVTAAAAVMVRYAALAAVGAAALWAFGLKGSLRERVRRAVVAAVPGIVVTGLWALRARSVSDYSRGGGSLANLDRSFVELGATLADWLAPSVDGSLARVLLSLVVAAGAVAVLVGARRRAPAGHGDGFGRFQRAAGVFAACYAALVLLSRLFVDDRIPFDYRILSPLMLTAEIAVVAALGVAWRRWRVPVRAAGAAVLVAWMSGPVLASADIVDDVLENGWDYGQSVWRGAPIGEWLRTRAGANEIFSNNPAIVWFLTGRPSRDLPQSLDPDSLRSFAQALSRHHGVLVGFPYAYDRTAAPDSIAARLRLPTAAQYQQGTVWGSWPDER